MLEEELAHEQLGALLVLADLAERHCARAKTVGLFHTVCHRAPCTLNAYERVSTFCSHRQIKLNSEGGRGWRYEKRFYKVLLEELLKI